MRTSGPFKPAFGLSGAVPIAISPNGLLLAKSIAFQVGC
jgi:hypothetical protein